MFGPLHVVSKQPEQIVHVGRVWTDAMVCTQSSKHENAVAVCLAEMQADHNQQVF